MKADSKSKEAVLDEIAKSNFDSDFDTAMNWGGKELREVIHDAMDAWHTHQSAEDKERIKELEAALKAIISVENRLDYPNGMNFQHPNYLSEHTMIFNIFKNAKEALNK